MATLSQSSLQPLGFADSLWFLGSGINQVSAFKFTVFSLCVRVFVSKCLLLIRTVLWNSGPTPPQYDLVFVH